MEKSWTVGTLKSRGWTETLMAQLLPQPGYIHANGRRVRSWEREAVMQAEQSARFQAIQAARRAQAQSEIAAGQAQTEQALENAATFLQSAWAYARTAGETPQIRLAEQYHLGILGQMKTVSWAQRIKPGQSMSYVERFLTLQRGRYAGELCAVFRQFVTAAPWMGRNTAAPLMQSLFGQYALALDAIAQRELDAFAASQPEANIHGLLALDHFPALELLSHPLSYIYSVSYVPNAIRGSLAVLVALNPKDEYPEARAMQRHFVLHLGGTNTGKTYAGFQRLIQADTGVYLAPLRLLALEAQELLLEEGVNCALTTGEEEDRQQGDTHVAATAEKLSLRARYDVAVIDECQMITDRARGYAWTRAILGVLAPEVHLCAAPEAKSILLRLIRSCGDSFEIIEHRRKTPLLCMDRVVDYLHIQPGDALITFSKVGVLSVAEELRQHGKNPAIIYGALPYSTRRRQVEGFLRGDMEYVVSTDAIGMGLNLPIRRIIFMETEKFDGVERRELKPEEIQQIAGRAGRYGMYDRGYVGATQNLSQISAALDTVVPPLEYAVVGFSDLVLQVDFDLLEVLEVWNKMPTVDPYRKLDISRYISLIGQMRDRGFHLSRQRELRAANIPFDETEEPLRELFYKLLRDAIAGQLPEQPRLPDLGRTAYTLPELELYCRQLDLFFSFSRAFDLDIDTEALRDAREDAAEQINRILLHNLKNNIRFCSQCGAALPLHHQGKLCTACYQKRARAATRPPWQTGRQK